MLIMRVASGLFSWSMAAVLLAFSSRQFAPTIYHGPLSASHNTFCFSFLSKRSGRRLLSAERIALYIFYKNANTSPITLYLVCKFQGFFSFWIAYDIQYIEVDTKEQVARHNQPNIYIYIHTKVDNKILRSNTHDMGRNHE